MNYRGNIPRRKPRISPEKRQEMREEREARRVSARIARLNSLSMPSIEGVRNLPDDEQFALTVVTGRTVERLIQDVAEVVQSQRTAHAALSNDKPE